MAPISVLPRAGATARRLASRVTIANGAFRIDGTPTYAGRTWRGHRIEGRLFNSRMANAIADDENPETRGAWSYADGPWDAERSTREFIAALPAYRAHGLLAVCLEDRFDTGVELGVGERSEGRIEVAEAAGAINPLVHVVVPGFGHIMHRVLGETGRGRGGG